MNFFFFQTATNKKGHVYDLGSIQYLNGDPKESAVASLQRNLDVDMRVKTMEDTMQVMKQGLDVLLRLNRINPVIFKPTGQRPSLAEGALSAATPSTPSVSVAQQPNQAAAQQPNQTSPINLADMTPQSVEGFEFEDHY